MMAVRARLEFSKKYSGHTQTSGYGSARGTLGPREMIYIVENPRATTQVIPNGPRCMFFASSFCLVRW